MVNIQKFMSIRLLNFIRGVLFSSVYIFLPKNRNRIIFSSTVNRDYNHNSKYLFEYFLKKYPWYEIKFVINDSLLKQKLSLQLGDYFISTTSIKDIFYCLRAYTWIVSSLETPVGGIFLNTNRLVVHLGHGTPFKNIGFMEKNLSYLKLIYYYLIKNNFTYVLSTSHNYDQIMMDFLRIRKENIITSNQPRTDFIFRNRKNFLKDNFFILESDKNILYAPTWRQKEETILFPFEDFDLRQLENFLEENKINIFLRVHPDFEKDLNKNLKKTKRVYIFDSNIIKEVTECLSCFDLLLTDYSSIFIDYLMLNRPVAFIPYDLEKYSQNIGFTVDFDKHTPGPKIINFKTFKYEILKLLYDSNYYFNLREREKNFYNIHSDDKACERLAKFIINKIGG